MKEASLVAAAKSGESGRLDTEYRAHSERLFRTVLRITRNYEDAEDAVQDSFLKAFLHLQSFDGRSTFSTWLTRIGINSALMILRKRRNSRKVSAQDSNESDAFWEITDSAPDPEKQYVEKERSEEHTSELQSRQYLVCRLLLEKKKKDKEKEYQITN